MKTIESSAIKPNAKQQECIDNIDGKYLVLAGPGTGKTFTVTRRIAAMLEKGIDPKKILCLSFSDTAANEMRKKLADAFGKVDVGVNVYTFHGFCNEIISENAEAFELSDNYRLISNTVARQFIKECIDEYNPVAYRNNKNDPYVYLTVISKKIEAIKNNRIKKEQYFHNIDTHPDWKPQITQWELEREELNNKIDKTKSELKKIVSLTKAIEDKLTDIQKATEIWDFYELYKSKMEKEQYIDFNDMIGFILDKFETSPQFLEKIANKYDYILVDEYQDTNKSQNEIIFHLVHSLKSQNVFVVGDDDQIIFSFQGASLNTVEGFLKEFPDTKVICFTENRRSTQSILDVARVIAKQDDRRLEVNPEFKQYNISKELVAMNEDLKPKESKVRLTKYFDYQQEYFEIVNEIEELINSPNCPVDKKTGKKSLSEIAILATSHDDLAKFFDLLKNRNIPCEVKDGKSIFEIKSSIILYYYLQMLVNPVLNADKIYKLLLLPPFNFNPQDYLKLYEQESFNGSLIDKMRKVDDWAEPQKIQNFLKTYDYLKEFQACETVRNIVLETGAKTGIFGYFTNEQINKNENITGLKKLVDEAKDFSTSHNKITLEEFVEYLQTIEADRELDILTDKPAIPLNAVQLTTYHSSKGREFEYVYMPTLQSSKWDKSGKSFKPIIPVDKSEYHDEDYWRLYRLSDRVKTMYVGMTRAKHTLRLSYVANAGKKATSPCAWILDAQPLLDVQDRSEYNLDTYNEDSENALVKRPYDYERDFKSLIETKLKDRYYSPSAINTYLSCPRRYLYEDILSLSPVVGNADALHYGTCVHSACEFMMNEAIKNGSYPDKAKFLKKFKMELDKCALSDIKQRKILEERGENELSNYYHHLTDTPVSNIFALEYKIKSEIDGVKFIGIIDRVEKNSDGTYSIYDYKTGEVKTSSKIRPGGDNENYYNQLCLYKYYFEKITGEIVRDTEFIFIISPETDSRYGFTEDETNEVVEKFKGAIKDINSCKFEPTEDKSNCKYCGFKDFCKLDVV